VIEPALRQAEIVRAQRKRPESLDAYDLYLRAFPIAFATTPQIVDKALDLLERAIAIASDYAAAHALIAWCLHTRCFFGGSADDVRLAALRHARIAVAVGGDSVTFGQASTAILFVGTGAEAGSTASTASIGQTKVLNAADGMKIGFQAITTSSTIVDVVVLLGATNITQAENTAVQALGGPGVAFFIFGGNEYFIATNHAELGVSSTDAIVKLVGVHDLVHPSISSGVVTLHV
jgi:hypothetical protein